MAADSEAAGLARPAVEARAAVVAKTLSVAAARERQLPTPAATGLARPVVVGSAEVESARPAGSVVVDSVHPAGSVREAAATARPAKEVPRLVPRAAAATARPAKEAPRLVPRAAAARVRPAKEAPRLVLWVAAAKARPAQEAPAWARGSPADTRLPRIFRYQGRT